MDNPKNLIAALAYAKIGWQVFAIRHKSKAPLTLHGFHDATTSKIEIRKWWKKNPACGVGIATGSKSRIIVVDIDPRNKGNETLESLELQYGELPRTVEARTGGGGRHLVYECPPGIWPGVKNLWPGVDIKSDGGYILAPFSVHPTGLEYKWAVDLGPKIPGEEGGIDIAPCPTWLLEAMKAKLKSRLESTKEHLSAKDDDEKYPEGTRNDALTSLAGTMRRRAMIPQAMLAALLVENELKCDPPLDETQVSKIVDSVCRYEADPDASPVKISSEAREGRLLQWTDPIQMASEREPPVEWLLEGWIAKGDCSLLFGPPACGKSWLTLDMAITLATARPTFGKFQHENEAKVLVIDEENPPNEVWRRVRCLTTAWELDPQLLGGQLFISRPRQGFTFKNPSYEYALQKSVEEIQPDLIILDSITALSSITNEADAVEVRAFFHDKLYPLQNIHECAILAVHHSTKGIYQKEQMTSDPGLARGSIDFAGAADSVMMVRSFPMGNMKTVKATKIRRGKIPPPFNFSIIDGHAGGARPMEVQVNPQAQPVNVSPSRPDPKPEDQKPSEPSKAPQIRSEILRLVKENGSAVRQDLFSWVPLAVPGASEPNIQKCLNQLRMEGKLESDLIPHASGAQTVFKISQKI
jgi:hypothetical protein